MKIELTEKPKKGAIIIEGFPGFGLVSTIVTEFLIDHLNAKQIGRIETDKIQPIVAIHKSEMVDPLGIFYDKKNNILFIRAIAPVNNLEWEISDTLTKFIKDIGAKEFISIEGIGSENKSAAPEAFFFSSNPSTVKKFNSMNIKPLNEGIIVGVTASFLAKSPESTFIFTEAYSNMPDSRAAAKIIEILDEYLGLDVDYKPLLKKAENFEDKIKDILSKSADTMKQKEKKESYFG
jgi:uncharacterized protein